MNRVSCRDLACRVALVVVVALIVFVAVTGLLALGSDPLR